MGVPDALSHIEADDPRDMTGQRRAVADAKVQVLPDITVEPLDLGPVRRRYLISPTWMFRPATPLWSYVAQTGLTGREVVLVTTGNRRFAPSEIAAFGTAVTARGGQLTDHIFLRHGRIYWQKSRDELLQEVRMQRGGRAFVLPP